METSTTVFSGLMWLPLLSLLGIGAAVLLAFCVYYDACAERNPQAVMWAVLCGFFGWIPALVYVILRSRGNNRLLPACGAEIKIGPAPSPVRIAVSRSLSTITRSIPCGRRPAASGHRHC